MGGARTTCPSIGTTSGFSNNWSDSPVVQAGIPIEWNLPPLHSLSQVIGKLEAEDASSLQSIAAAAQAFGQRYLGQHAKALYFSRAVEMYNQHFQGGREFVSSLQDQDLGNFDSILDAFSHYGKSNT